MKLSQGEYISLTQATEYYGLADVVDFVFVYADPKHSEPIAIVWPKPKCIEEWAARGISDIENSPEVKKEVIASLLKVHQQRKLRGFERINHVLVKLDAPTVENGLLTPTLKAQLRRIEGKYKSELEELYLTVG